ncbi:MAG: hypothetical protein AMXMBFR77_23030 [Phycisphaerales bacterium]|nr:MAG: hypothetical protein BroJett004_25990 [Planctomycetota bacterium]
MGEAHPPTAAASPQKSSIRGTARGRVAFIRGDNLAAARRPVKGTRGDARVPRAG